MMRCLLCLAIGIALGAAGLALAQPTPKEKAAGSAKFQPVLEQELKELDRQIREARRSAQIAPVLADKLSIQKQIRELEAARTRKRRELFDAQDRIDKQRQDLIETIEKKLQQDCNVTPVFTVRWSLI